MCGFEKNAFGGLAGYSAPRAIGMAAGCLLLALAPVLAIAQDVSLAARLRFDLPLVPGLLAPFTHAIMAWALLRATVACLSRGGIRWRGTIYSLAELRAGRRVSFP